MLQTFRVDLADRAVQVDEADRRSVTFWRSSYLPSHSMRHTLRGAAPKIRATLGRRHSTDSWRRVDSSTRPIRVLIVDDEPDTVMTLLALVRDHGHEAEGVDNGRDALDSIDRLDADVVVSDIVMRVPNGWDIARAVRMRGRERPLLIAISGKYTNSSNPMFAQMVGFDFFLPKPCEPRALMALIEQARFDAARA